MGFKNFYIEVIYGCECDCLIEKINIMRRTVASFMYEKWSYAYWRDKNKGKMSCIREKYLNLPFLKQNIIIQVIFQL